MNLSSNNSKYSTVSSGASKANEATEEWVSKVDYEEMKDDFYFNYNSPLLQSKEEEEEILHFFDYFCMVIGILSKTQTFFVGVILFYVEEENLCLVSKYANEPLHQS